MIAGRRQEGKADAMTISLHHALIPGWLQLIASTTRLIDAAERHCAEADTSAADLLDARLAMDMLPFAYQVKSVSVHSRGAIEGVRNGVFVPDRTTPPDSFAGLREQLAGTTAALEATSEDEMQGFVGRDMAFVLGERRMEFLAEDFLLSFSQPNFYFHVSTAYAILRAQGLAIGKRDYLGAPRLRG